MHYCPLCEKKHGARCPTEARIQESERAAERAAETEHSTPPPPPPKTDDR